MESKETADGETEISNTMQSSSISERAQTGDESCKGGGEKENITVLDAGTEEVFEKPDTETRTHRGKGLTNWVT